MPLAFIFAFFYNIPKFFELTTHKSIFTNKTLIVGSNLRRDPLYVSIYLTWMKIIILELFPYITIFSLNICIMKKVFNASKFRMSFKREYDSCLTSNVNSNQNLVRYFPKFKAKFFEFSRAFINSDICKFWDLFAAQFTLLLFWVIFTKWGSCFDSWNNLQLLSFSKRCSLSAQQCDKLKARKFK